MRKCNTSAFELLGILQKRKVAHLWSTVRDVVSHEERIFAFDRLVMIRIHDPGRDLDAGKIVTGPIRLRLHILVICARNASYSVGVDDSFSYSFLARAQTNGPGKLLLSAPWPVQTTHDQLMVLGQTWPAGSISSDPRAVPEPDAHIGNKVMTRTALDRRVLLTLAQKVEAAKLRTMGFTRSQAWRRVLTLEQRQVFYEQIRAAERLRYIENPHREIIKRARNIRNSARRRGAKYNAWEFTITEEDLDWPTHCPVLPWIELHYPGRYRNDPAGASLDRIDHQRGYLPGNVRVISLRANLLRKDITYQELRALADFFVT